LVEAEVRCKAQGEAWTAPRCRIYEVLLAAEDPRTAYELMAAYKRGRRPAAPPTVYRALDFLVGIGLAHRVESRKAYLACTAPAAPHAAAFLLCDVCGRTDELMHDPEDWGPPPSDFLVRTSLLEIHGTCSRCRGGPRPR
jgi:Fur family zinc uptake transcriptional regulator